MTNAVTTNESKVMLKPLSNMTRIANKIEWSKEGSGRYVLRGVGRIATRVVDYDNRSGIGKTKWVAYCTKGYRIGGLHASKKQAQTAVVSNGQIKTMQMKSQG